MLRLVGGQVESLFDEALRAEVRALPADLAALDELLGNPALLAPIEAAWEQSAREHGRPNDRDGHVRAVDGDQAPHGLGV